MQRFLTLKWRIGVRTAALIGRLARRFQADIRVSVGVITVDPKQMFCLLALGPDSSGTNDQGPLVDTPIVLRADGPDATEAMNTLVDVFSAGSSERLCLYPSCPSTPILVDCSPEEIHYACSQGHQWAKARSDGRLLWSAEKDLHSAPGFSEPDIAVVSGTGLFPAGVPDPPTTPFKFWIERCLIQPTYRAWLCGSRDQVSKAILEDIALRVGAAMPPAKPLVVFKPESLPLPGLRWTAELRGLRWFEGRLHLSKLFVCWFTDEAELGIEQEIGRLLPLIHWHRMAVETPCESDSSPPAHCR